MAEAQDQQLNVLALLDQGMYETANNARGVLAASRNELRVVELFSGAGGMGLGFLMSSSEKTACRIVHTSECDPICIKSIFTNYSYWKEHAKVLINEPFPSEIAPTDLSTAIGRESVVSQVQRYGGVDILIGGPPCQGFSQANRNSWSPNNPYNKLVNNFIELAIALNPKVILMENVQGILWTPRSNHHENKLGVVEHITRKLAKTGYVLFPSVLDAAWYGVPQHRNRFFLLALDQSLGYTEDSFGNWGPFPFPTHGPITTQKFVTVRDAISDLPKVENGEGRLFQDYKNPRQQDLALNVFLNEAREFSQPGVIEGHIVSKQADYVLERYKNIPEGGNWSDIQHMMTNYSKLERTHSNIYRRLKWDEPSITIGNYRKSMLIHPAQDRGLSLREATRLQSFPDWFVFCGVATKRGTTLMHKQQQLANAVSFLLIKAIAKYILTL
ncbi:DNA cytosine methyltransferase [Gloeobacter kilaueensis]|uniref:DNA cytosine methyltransferase n=1 Tax=Gloeobacter kilaueensis TaxID=1416614 RepID=UPI001651358B|nr:DNA cytosine methyltransferase [Gloeobacter kilaueensis]